MTSRSIGGYTSITVPISLIHQAHLDVNGIFFEVRSDGLLIKSANHPRKGWEKYYAPSENQENFFESIEHEFDEEDWQWE